MTAPTPIRAVLYDFDGTLADGTELIMRCYRHTMRTHLGECPPDEECCVASGPVILTLLDLS
ncbi:MAG TPA: HAD hydrolase-like protein [Longimicrobium sp.]